MLTRTSRTSRLATRTLGAVAIAGAVFLPVACARHRDDDPRVLAEYVHALYGAIRVERLSPPVASRLAAYAMTALYAGEASANSSMVPLAGTLNNLPALVRASSHERVDGTLVAIAAERVVLDSLLREALPTTKSSLAHVADSLSAARAAEGIDASTHARSDALGHSLGVQLVAWSRADGFDGTRGRPYVPPVGEALWFNDSPASNYTTQNISGASELVTFDNPANQQRASNTSDRGLILSRPKSATAKTVPAVNMAGATEPYWREVRPFVLKTWDGCTIAPPPPYSTDSASPLFRGARVVFETHATLTAEQREIAYYWADNAGETGTPVGHWLSIASQLISERHLSAADAAQLLLATAVAQADAFIAAWGYKYAFNLLRPRTYIRRVMDKTWEPLIPTPPFPEHPAGHSTQSAAAATVITAALGDVPFTDSTSISLGHAVRHFSSFIAASDEAGLSRIYGGIHLPTGNAAGKSLGTCIGEQVKRVLHIKRLGP